MLLPVGSPVAPVKPRSARAPGSGPEVCAPSAQAAATHGGAEASGQLLCICACLRKGFAFVLSPTEGHSLCTSGQLLGCLAWMWQEDLGGSLQSTHSEAVLILGPSCGAEE